MNNNTITKSGPPLAETDLAALEGRLRCSLPPLYRQFLLAHNGGTPEISAFKFSEDDYGWSDVMAFLGVCEGMEGIDYACGVCRPFMHARLLPIAYDAGGNFVCISTSGEDCGAVYFWDHEEEYLPSSEGNVSFIAPSFDAFFEGLYTPEEDEPNPLADELWPMFWADDAGALAARIDAGLDVNATVLGMPLIENTVLPPREKIMAMLLRRGANYKKALEDARRFKKTIPSQDAAFQRNKAMLEKWDSRFS